MLFRSHIQLYVEVSSALSINGLKELLGSDSWHLERAVHPAEAYTYCGKEDTRVYGPFSGGYGPPTTSQGRRSDLEEVSALVLGGQNPMELSFMRKYPAEVCRYGRHLRELWSRVASTPRNEQPLVIIFWGRSGVGKSHRAFTWDTDRFNRLAERTLALDDETTESGSCDIQLYVKQPGKWWCGYEFQRRVIFNDFEPLSWEFSWNEFKRLTDKWPINYEVKGATTSFNSKYVIFTSNSDPSGWWFHERSAPSEAEVWANRNIVCVECLSKTEYRFT